MPRGKKALVAGGAGFIGSHLCEYLLAKGYQVLVIDNLITGVRKNIEPLFSLGVDFIERDIEDDSIILAVGEGPIDEIYNLASPASPIDFTRIPLKILSTASEGHRNLLELAKLKKARILFASTSEVYGDPLEHPQSEDYFGNVNPVGERSCYDEAKRFGETLTMAYHKKEGVETRIVRIFNTYGPRMRLNDGRIIPNFFLQALMREPLTIYGEGHQTRSFCYVADLVDGIYRLMQSAEISPINLGNPIEKSVLEMAEIINEMTENICPHRFLDLPENDPRQRRPDLSKAKRVLGWGPSTSLEEGLHLTFKYFKGVFEETKS